MQWSDNDSTCNDQTMIVHSMIRQVWHPIPNSWKYICNQLQYFLQNFAPPITGSQFVLWWRILWWSHWVAIGFTTAYPYDASLDRNWFYYGISFWGSHWVAIGFTMTYPSDAVTGWQLALRWRILLMQSLDRNWFYDDVSFWCSHWVAIGFTITYLSDAITGSQLIFKVH